MTEDRELVDAVLRRQPGAFEALVRAHQRLCHVIVVRMVRDPEDARELCQEAFLLVYRRLHQFRHDSTLKSWIGRIAFRLALRHLGRRRVPTEAVSAEPSSADPLDEMPSDADVEGAAIAEQERARVRRGIEALPPVQRTVLTLYHLEDVPIAEIAAMTELPEGTVKSHLFRARAALRRLLEDAAGGAR